MAGRQKKIPQGPKPGKGKAARPRGGGKEILFGFHSVYEALRAEKRSFKSVMLSDRRQDSRVEKTQILALEKQIPIKRVSGEALDRMARDSHHQGIVAEVSAFPVKDSRLLLREIHGRSAPFFILLAESIEDTHNLGALIRTGVCAGVDYIIIPKDRSALPSPGVSRSSAGAMEHAPIFQVTNTASLIRSLKNSGAWVSGLDAGGDRDIFQSDFTGNLVLVVGGENKGIRPVVRKECDFIVSIPISGQVNSLNASVAGGIAMYEALRQRQTV
jgi:23S rRNA (guanosine2251-2'-O)-methyltransferase